MCCNTYLLHPRAPLVQIAFRNTQGHEMLIHLLKHNQDLFMNAHKEDNKDLGDDVKDNTRKIFDLTFMILLAFCRNQKKNKKLII